MAVSAVRSAGLGAGGQGYRLIMMPASGGCCAGEFFLFFLFLRRKVPEKIVLKMPYCGECGHWHGERGHTHGERGQSIWGTWAHEYGKPGHKVSADPLWDLPQRMCCAELEGDGHDAPPCAFRGDFCDLDVRGLRH